MQPFQYDLRSSAAKDNSITHAAAAPSNLDAATTMRFAASRSKPASIYGRGSTKWQQSWSHSNAICYHSFKKRIELRTQEQPLVAKHIGGTIRDRNDRSRNRRTDEVPFIAGCSHFTRKNTRFRAPASSPTQSPCNIMQPFQCDLLPQLQETHRTTHTGTTTRCKTHRRNNSRQKRPQPQPPHRRGTFHRRLQPLYTEKHKVSCSGFLPNTKPVQHSCSHSNAICHCNVQSHTTLHQGQSFCDVLLCNAKSHTTLHQGQSFCYVLLCNVMSHTTLHQGQFFSDVLLCHVKSHTTLHQGQSLNRAPPFIILSLRILFVRNTEVLLPNFLWLGDFLARPCLITREEKKGNLPMPTVVIWACLKLKMRYHPVS